MAAFSLKRSIGIWFCVAAAILIANASFIYASFQRFENQKFWVEHTYEVINNLESALTALLEVQSAVRGFVITGRQDYLAPYEVAVPAEYAALATLDRLLKDNALQYERLTDVKTRVERRIDIAENVISTYQNDGQAAAMALIKTGAGKREMDEIRASIAEMVTEEKRLLALRQQNVDEASLKTLVAGAGGLATCIAILAFVFFLIKREMLYRQSAEEALLDTLQDTKRISAENSQLSQIADYLQGCQTMDEAFSILSTHAPRLLPGTTGAIMLFNNSRNMVKVVECWGECEKIEDEFLPDACWALRRGQMHHVTADGEEPVCQHIREKAKGGSVCYPMQAHGDTVGIFYVSAKKEAALDKEDMLLVRRISEQASLAISNLKLRDKLRDQSVRDGLTGLFNRRYLEETMEREMARSTRMKQPLSVLVMDIDHFKKYNDTLGHDAGDALLIHFAKLVQNNVRKEDIACRYGGEEFVVVMPQASAEMAEKRAQEICAATRDMTVKIKDGEMSSVTVSIGVSTFPGHAETTMDLIHIADKALYKAKHEGRDQVRVGTIDRKAANG